MFSAELEAAWSSCAPADINQFETLPPGKYVASIDAVKLIPQRVVGDTTIPTSLVYEMTVTEGEHEHTRFRKEDMFWGVKSMQFIKRDMITLGCKIPAGLEHVALALQPAVGTTVEVSVRQFLGKTGKEYMNVYINRLVSLMKAPTAQNAKKSEGAKTDSEDDWANRYDNVPF